MKSKLVLAAFFVSLLGCTNPAENREDNSIAKSRIYFGGDIITMAGDNPEYAEAVVEVDGKIVFIGSKDEAFSNHKNAEKHDLQSKTMMPAFIDPHSHFMSAIRMVNQVNVAAPPVGTATDIPAILKLLENFKQERNIQDGDWIVGWGYDQDLLKEKRHITKMDIDKIFPNNKVLIIHVSMHGAILNSQALVWAGIDENSTTPEGGVIARLPGTNEPAGLLMEMAYIPVFAKMPQPSTKEMLELMKPAQMMYASNGYTQAVEGFSHVTDMDFLLKAAAENKIFLDIISLPGFTEMDTWLANPKYPFGEYHNHLKFGGGKFTLDGSPQGKTAYMSYPYRTGGPNGEKNWYGNTSIPKETLAKMAKTMVEHNIQINFHANGGGAIDDAIYAIEEAGITAQDDKRSIIIHSQFQTPEQLKKYVELGISPSYFTNHTFFWGDVHIKNVGEESAAFISPLKSAKEAGIITSNHTDFNVTPLNPFFVLWTATNRITRSGKVLGPAERVDTYTALQGLTTGPAYQFFEENRKGKIKEGLLADFVILKNNPLKQNPVNNKDNEVLETIKEGKTIFKK